MGCNYYTNDKGEFRAILTFYDESGNKVKEEHIIIDDLNNEKHSIYFDLLEGEER